jgi:retinal rod rhodopsin-sensitive cGMP 3',5'-cyclic phosphodiesterase subunit delta
MLHGHCVEEWVFSFGFVMPNSTNSWQQVIKSAGKGKMRKPESLSGNVTIHTSFYDACTLITKYAVKMYYLP